VYVHQYLRQFLVCLQFGLIQILVFVFGVCAEEVKRHFQVMKEVNYARSAPLAATF
jgi:hypothetical protein